MTAYAPRWPVALAWTATWRPDGGKLALLVRKTMGVVVDLQTFTVARTIPNVTSAWWEAPGFCYAPRADGATSPENGRHKWHAPGSEHLGPPGLLITGVSGRGEAMLGRIGPRHEEGYRFSNLAVACTDPDKHDVAWLRTVHAEPEPTLEFTESDSLTWNANRQAAAVVVGTDTAGGLACSSLHVVTKEASIALLDTPGLYPKYHCSAASPPAWVSDEVLAVVRLWREWEERGELLREDRFVLVLFDPWKHTAQTLLEHPKLRTAAATRDGKCVAYALGDGRGGGNQLTITSMAELVRQGQEPHPER